MNPSSLTTYTTRRRPKSSSRSSPATRSPRTCMTRNSLTRPSAELSLHHSSFRSEENHSSRFVAAMRNQVLQNSSLRQYRQMFLFQNFQRSRLWSGYRLHRRHSIRAPRRQDRCACRGRDRLLCALPAFLWRQRWNCLLCPFE